MKNSPGFAKLRFLAAMKKSGGRVFEIGEEFLQGKEFKIAGKQLKIGSEAQCVKMRIDPSGMILYWDFLKSRHGEFVFVDCIIDCRIPKENKREMTVVCSKDFKGAKFFGFESMDEDEETVKRWSEFIFKWAYWNKRQYHSVLRHMQRIFAPFLLEDNPKHKRVNVYEHLMRPYKNVLDKFKLGSSLASITSRDQVLDVYVDKVERPEVEQIFNQICKGEPKMSAEKFAHFINVTQRDSRLNEENYPAKTISQIERLIKELEEVDSKELTKKGFLKYLLGEWNVELDSAQFKLNSLQMNNPITHYYINSSHNTYLSGNQIHAANTFLSGRFHTTCLTETEMYRITLLAGCRCIELDCWDGPTGPVITHGPISLQKINVVPFREVCEAIMETAFKSTDYPIVLSLENHCSPAQQQQMANHFIEVFGDHLQGTPLDSHPLELGKALPSPNDLRRKILLKGSKYKKHNEPFYAKLKQSAQNRVERIRSKMQQQTDDINKRQSQISITSELSEISNISKDFMKDEAIDTTETAARLADLINYFQTTPTLNYEDPEYLMHSGSELKIDKIITKSSTEFIQHTARHIVRVYPEIFRCNSSNFLPVYFWSAGCQMLALNFQTPGIEMQMNQTLFEENGQTGYVLKAQALREKSHKVSVHDKHISVANKMKIKVISAQLLNLMVPKKDEKFTTSVHVDLYDLTNDTKAGDYKTSKSMSADGGYNTYYTDNTFHFEKIIKPEHAMLHIKVLDGNEELIGQRFLVVHKMRTGYRHIILRNNNNQSEGPASVFVKIEIKIYSSLGLQGDFTNPLKSAKEKEEERKKIANRVRQTQGDKR